MPEVKGNEQGAFGLFLILILLVIATMGNGFDI